MRCSKRANMRRPQAARQPHELREAFDRRHRIRCRGDQHGALAPRAPRERERGRRAAERMPDHRRGGAEIDAPTASSVAVKSGRVVCVPPLLPCAAWSKATTA